MSRMLLPRLGLGQAWLPFLLLTTPVNAEEIAPAIELSAELTTDIASVMQGTRTGTRWLSNLNLVGTFDLERLAGWRGARANLHVLSNQGGRPNDLAGTLQGINNIEVAGGRTKLYQAWIEQDILGGRGAVLFGLSDLNADFYQNDSAGVLLAPAFGIGSELAATGPNGPSIFPSTALTVRLRFDLRPHTYLKGAVVNARSGVLGDVGGIDLSLRDGALLIGEIGWTGRGKVAVGYWQYTRRQDDIRQVGLDGVPVRRIAKGGYLLVEQPLPAFGSAGVAATLFARLGISDGATTPFAGGWQVGALMTSVFKGRPDSQISFGAYSGRLSQRYLDTASDAGTALAGAETGIEATYSDQLTPWLRIQPDVLYVKHPGGDRAAPDAVVVAVRFVLNGNRSIH